jgi:hypothetical protein
MHTPSRDRWLWEAHPWVVILPPPPPTTTTTTPHPPPNCSLPPSRAEVEEMVCGSVTVDVEMLRRTALYEGCSSSDRHVGYVLLPVLRCPTFVPESGIDHGMMLTAPIPHHQVPRPAPLPK